ncbi:MAG: co-chaperone GroES [Firmicutes bacterium]|uniref:10 kDa chaperonin n=1 Tax=Candidatus Scatoplasma merdavium TaxID=2840932 RepID=A0A9D9D8Y1_9BACL|nr:co-chaperone GroES [Candidatus Scatoplasma merdavium]
MIKPLHNYVLLEAKKDEKMVGSIVVTSEVEKKNIATVVAIGPGYTNEHGELIKPSSEIKVGDRVLYKEYSTTEYKEGDKKYFLLKDSDIIAVIE